MWKFIRVLIGLFLLPCCAAASRAVYFMLAGTGSCGETGGATFLLGIGVGLVLWVAVFIFLPVPIKSYVLAHELTHVLWGHFLGAAVLEMRVSKTGGNVKLSESNIFIALAPYFFPLYSILVICAYFLLSVFFDLQKYHSVFLAAVGFTLGFHLFFTVSALAIKQSDIENYGKVFSYALIYFMNALIIGLLIVAVSPVSLVQFAARLAADMVFVWAYLWSLLLVRTIMLKTLILQPG